MFLIWALVIVCIFVIGFGWIFRFEGHDILFVCGLIACAGVWFFMMSCLYFFFILICPPLSIPAPLFATFLLWLGLWNRYGR